MLSNSSQNPQDNGEPQVSIRAKTPDWTEKDIDVEAASSDAAEVEDEKETSKRNYTSYILVGTALVILG